MWRYCGQTYGIYPRANKAKKIGMEKEEKKKHQSLVLFFLSLHRRPWHKTSDGYCASQDSSRIRPAVTINHLGRLTF